MKLYVKKMRKVWKLCSFLLSLQIKGRKELNNCTFLNLHAREIKTPKKRKDEEED